MKKLYEIQMYEVHKRSYLVQGESAKEALAKCEGGNYLMRSALTYMEDSELSGVSIDEIYENCPELEESDIPSTYYEDGNEWTNSLASIQELDEAFVYHQLGED